jgi:hemerythrin-like domain-containing protein
MRRSAALQGLSREHHAALVVALGLTRADAGTAEDAAGRFRDFWNEHGRAHFVVEEEVLLPALDPVDGQERPEVMRLLLDHTAIRRLAARLPERGAPVEQLHDLGRRLHDHVRFEERELFPLLESLLEEPELQALVERHDAP